MKFVFLSLFLLLAPSCVNKKNSSSDTKVVDSDTNVLELRDGFYGELLTIDEGRVVYTLDKLGNLDYTIHADIAIGDIKVPRTLVFKRVYQINPEFVQFKFLRSLPLLKAVSYSEKGTPLATAMKTEDADGKIKLSVTHSKSGTSLLLTLSEGRFGIASIESIELDGTADVKIKDPDGRTTSEWPGSYFNLKPLIHEGWIYGSMLLSKVK